MVRSLIGVIFAVVIGLTTAKFIEGAGGTLYPPSTTVEQGDIEALKASASAVPLGYKFFLLLGWAVAAFISALIALLIGQRWAPLGWLAAVTMFFLAVMTLIGSPFGWWLWPCAGLATGSGGWLAVRVTGASNQYAVSNDKSGFLE